MNEKSEMEAQLENECRLIREGNKIIREGLLKSLYEVSLQKYEKIDKVLRSLNDEQRKYLRSVEDFHKDILQSVNDIT